MLVEERAPTMERSLNYDGKAYFVRFPKDLTSGWKGKEKARKRCGAKDEALLALEHGAVGLREMASILLDGKLRETTVGRVIFQESLGADYPFVNEQMNAKKLGGILGDILRRYRPKEAEEILDRMKELGFEYATKSATTWGMSDLIVPPEKPGLLLEAEKEIAQIDEHWRNGLLSREELPDRSHRHRFAHSVASQTKPESPPLFLVDGPWSMVLGPTFYPSPLFLESPGCLRVCSEKATGYKPPTPSDREC